MLMKVEFYYPDGLLPLTTLKEHGFSQIQRQARVYPEFADYLDEVETSVTERR